MAFWKEKVDRLLGKLPFRTYHDFLDLEICGPVGYKTDNTFPTVGWSAYDGRMISGDDDHYWFRTKFTVPEAKEGIRYMLLITCGKENQGDATNPQGILYLNGKMIQGIDTHHYYVYLEPDTEYELYHYVYLALNQSSINQKIRIVEFNEVTEKLFYDIQVAYDSIKTMNENSEEYNLIMPYIEQAINCLDFRELYSDEFYAGIKAAQKIMDKFYNEVCSPDNKPVVACVGHTHIDVEWLWNRAQTREKIQRSFGNANELMKKYPEYKFMLSQPELYIYLKEEAPEKYEELKQLVKEGRWEAEGSMFVEADTNITSGEGLIRQIAHGKKFFKDEFGVDNHILFLPDVFGYTGALPQILQKCGVDRFVTSKISWNDTNTMPMDTFMWKGIDGTEIFSHFITCQNYTPDPTRYTTYVGQINPTQVKGCYHRYKQKAYSNEVLLTYGYGDGGGGPTAEMLENQRRLEKGIPGMPVTKLDTLENHIERVKAQFDKACVDLKQTPKWSGEMYLEFHRGTYTSAASVKRGNRKSEFGLQRAEAMSFTDLLFGGSYDTEGLDKAWKKVLHNHFHDILPGSSIASVYEGTDKDYAELEEFYTGVEKEKLSEIAKNIATDGGILVFNPVGLELEGLVKIDGKTYETEKIAPMGFKVLKDIDKSCHVKLDGLTAENDYYVMTLDKAGRIEKLYDKVNDREVFTGPANEIQTFEDIPRQYENWEISDYYKQKKWVVDSEAEITPVYDGSRAGFKVVQKYLKSTITQYIWLYSHNRRIDVDNDIDWQQHQILMKAAFPLDVNTDSVTCNIQFGNINRPTTANGSFEEAKFEISAHKWVDMSESGYGVAILNDCKYGYNVEENVLKLTMLKCGVWPNPNSDVGRHIFTYSILPHSGDFRQGGVVNEGYKLNQPLSFMEIGANSGKLGEEFSLVSSNKENIVIETVKKAEDSEDMVVRLYDAFGGKVKTDITVADGFKEAYLCDMLENEIEKLDFDGKSVKIPVSNYEVVTLKFKR